MTRSTDYVGGLYNDFRFDYARNQSELISQFYLRQITELACNRFKWNGLPEEDEGDIRVRYVELTLFRYGLVVFFKHKKWNKYLALRATNPGPLDMYYDPTAFHMYGNGTNPAIDGLTVSAKDAVPIWANYLRVPELDMVSIYSRRMAKFDRTVEINVEALRHPFVLSADKQTEQSIKEFYRQVEQGQPVIMVRTDLGKTLADSVQVLNMQVDKDLITNLLIDKRKVWNECLTFLGINNANQDKRERLVQSEVSANDSEVLATRRIALDARQHACEQINKKWGLNISVEWNVDVADMADMPAMQEVVDSEGGESGGDVHDQDS